MVTTSGLILIDKEPGMTSYGVDARLKKIFDTAKVGHVGTLDPFASGLLVCLIGKGTKLADILPLDKKEYIAVLKLGTKTDTLDPTGEAIEEKELPHLDDEQIKAAIASLVGESEQIPPMFSALKKEGVPLYKLARKGESVERPPRKITVYDAEFIKHEDDEITFSVTVSKGTYVRSLGETLAEKLGTIGHLASLRRTKVGKYRVDEAVKIDNVSAENLIPLEKALDFVPSLKVMGRDGKAALNGAPLHLASADDMLLIEDEDGPIALYARDREGKYVSRKGLR